ncbi:MAG: hypothetical protein ACK4HW_07760, partial [Roseinatronobacter sp.]
WFIVFACFYAQNRFPLLRDMLWFIVFACFYAQNRFPLLRDRLVLCCAWLLCEEGAGARRAIYGARWRWLDRHRMPRDRHAAQKANRKSRGSCANEPTMRTMARKGLHPGGRKLLRDALYMPALVAARVNPDLRETSHCMTTAGKAPKLGLATLMRKCVERANTLLRDNRKWTPIRP